MIYDNIVILPNSIPNTSEILATATANCEMNERPYAVSEHLNELPNIVCCSDHVVHIVIIAYKSSH